MISHISERLIGLFRYFAQTVPLKEMKFQGLPLFFRELLAQPVQHVPGGDLINKYRLVPGTNLLFIKLLSIVVLSVRQVLPAVHRPMVGNLNNPGGRLPSFCIEESRPPEVSQDARGNVQHRAAMATKQKR